MPEPPRADRLELARRLRGVTPPAPRAPSAEKVGDHRDFWVVQTEPPRAFEVGATLRATSDHAYFYVQDGVSASDRDMQAATKDFEERIWPGVTRLFGDPAPATINSDPRITILHVRLASVSGYFTGVDLLPREVASISNERRMIYVDLRGATPGGANYASLVAHEFQHLVHQGGNPVADAWLNEGLSVFAQAAVSGDNGEGFLKAFRDAPSTSLVDWGITGSNAAHYGAGYSFSSYLLARYGGKEQAGALVRQGGLGVNAVERYLRAGGFGVGFEDVFADWLVANYLNLPGAGRYTAGASDSKVRTIRKLDGPDDGAGQVLQFGADYFEITSGRRDMLFRIDGAATVKQTPNDPTSGRGQWWSGRSDSYDATLTRSIDLRAVSSATLTFKTWFDIELGYDYGYVELSEDGGATWRVLRGEQARDLDPLGQAYGSGYTGQSGGDTPRWIDERVDLGPWAGKSILLRFEYVTDEATSAAGWTIDDIAIPEIGLSDDAETDGGWQASGFRRLTGPLPQRYILQVARQDGNAWNVSRLTVDAQGHAEIQIPANSGRTVIVLAGATLDSNLPAAYRWSLVNG